MFLAIDVGNTQSTLGLFDEGGRLVRGWRMSTNATDTSDMLHSRLWGYFGKDGLDLGAVTDAGVASVVPALERAWRRCLETHLGHDPLVVSAGRDYGMDSALVMANVIYEDLSVLNVTAWQHWVAVSEVDYCDGLLYIDLEKQSFQCTKRYYAAGNFSKYIPYGAVRVAVHTGDPALKALAFVQGENTVVLLINDTPAEKTVSFAGLGTAAQLVVTDAHVNLQQRQVDPAAVTLPAKSVSTLLFSGTA